MEAQFHTVFNGIQSEYALAPHCLLGLVPIAVWLLSGSARANAGNRFLLAMGLVVLVTFNAIPNWDRWRIRRMAQTGEGLTVTTGTVTNVWHSSNRVRDYARSGEHYKTIEGEGLTIGGEEFAWNKGDGFSAATLNDFNQLARPVVKGDVAKITWFIDDAAQDRIRIVKLEINYPARSIAASNGRRADAGR